MFKTIEECRLELVSYSVLAVEPVSITMLQDSSATGARLYIPATEADADWLPCSAARASNGKEDKTGEDEAADRKLLRYLAKHQHMTPYEYQHATFLIEAPIFVLRQIDKHRTIDGNTLHLSANEISRRYTDEQIEFWIPDKWRKQAEKNKQASTEEEVARLLPRPSKDDPFGEKGEDPFELHKAMCLIAKNNYEHMIKSGVCREQARAELPQSLLARRYLAGNLRNWAAYLQLRDAEGVQWEHRLIAIRIGEHLRKLWPESCNALGI